MGMGRKTVRGSVTIPLYLLISNNFGLDPADDILKVSLEQYARERLTRVQKLARLQIDHGLGIGYNTLLF